MDYCYIREKDEQFEYCDYKDAEYVLLPIKEFNGLKKAIRVINDRALQQIDKSKADEYGFRLLRCDKKYNRECKGMLYLVTKETPYSCKIRSDVAWTLIENRLHEMYSWINDFDLEDFMPAKRTKSNTYGLKEEIYLTDIPKIISNWNDRNFKERDFLLENSDKGRAIKNIWIKHHAMIVDISKVSINYAQGVYEVSYWATGPL